MNKSEDASQTRGSWSGSFGFILAAVGSAVGLGNIWRFSYITGEYGGAVFILVYVGCALAVGIPVMLAEFLLGRRAQRDAVGVFRSLRPHSPWEATGWLALIAAFVILSFYAVVGGWVLHYLALSFHNGFTEQSTEEIGGLFSALSASPLTQIFWHAVFLATTIAMVSRGVSQGLEKSNKIMMPLLFLLLCILAVYALQTEGAAAGLNFLLRPRWEQLSTQAVLEALGQAFFSLSVGSGIMITYGSYLGRDTNLVRSAFYVAASDTGVAILAGFVIFPLVFTFQLEPGSGPGLIFRTLPIAFGQLPAGQVVALLFFFSLTFAALSSAISMLEVVVAYFVDEHGWSRALASWSLGGMIFLCGIPSVLSERFFGGMDALATNILLPVGGLLVALFTGWALDSKARHEEFTNGEIRQPFYAGWVFLVRFVAPLAVAIILVRSFVFS